MIRSAAVAVLLCVSLAAPAAGIYKRLDEAGKLEFLDRNLSDSERITRKYLVSRYIPPRDSLPPPPEYVAEIATACANQRDRLATYRDASQLYARDPSGNRVPLSSRQQRLMIVHVEQEVERLCRPRAAEKLFEEFRQRIAAGEFD